MFKRRTTFIVGAGASAEVGLPVGTELAKIISKKLDVRFADFGRRHVGDGDVFLFEHFRKAFRAEAQAYQEAAWLIRDGLVLSKSIDDFLDIHSNDERIKRIGKAAIVKAVLEAERKSTLFIDPHGSERRLPVVRLENSWYVKFMRMLGPGVRKPELKGIFNNISFIVFNYDRCIEQFLLHAIQQLYAVSENVAAELLSKIRIFHPYGAVGYLRTSSAPGGVPFGDTSQEILNLADKIKTYSEQIEEGEELEAIKQEVTDCQTLVFLGFGFHSQNMKLLRPKRLIKDKSVYGSAFGMSESDVNVVQDEIGSFFKGRPQEVIENFDIYLENKLKCSEIFDYFAKSLPS